MPDRPVRYRSRVPEDDARRPGSSGAPALPLTRVADRDLIEPHAVVACGPRDVQVTVDRGEHLVARVSAAGERGPAPGRELLVAQRGDRASGQRPVAG